MKTALQGIHRLLLSLSVVLLASFSANAQINPDTILSKAEDWVNYILTKDHDTSYIKSYPDVFGVKLLMINKHNFYKVRDRDLGTSLRYEPDSRLNLGFGIFYKWFSLDIVFNLGIKTNSSEFENSSFFDFTGRIFSSRQFVEITYKYFRGYLMADPGGTTIPVPESSKTREDIRSMSFGIQYLYAFNYGRFSLKAPFILNEKQKKSAGSTMGGANFGLFVLSSDTSIVPSELQTSFHEKLHLHDMAVVSIGLSFGYIHSFVWRENFFLTLGVIPGIQFNAGDYRSTVQHIIPSGLSVRLHTMNAAGFNSTRFFTGIQFVGNIFNVRLGSKISSQIGSGSGKLFVGWRL